MVKRRKDLGPKREVEGAEDVGAKRRKDNGSQEDMVVDTDGNGIVQGLLRASDVQPAESDR